MVKLEYLSPTGWQDAGTASLLYPARYPERLRANGKFGRCTALDARLKPTGRVWVSADVPADPSVLVATETGGIPWMLPTECKMCLELHGSPFDGSCLL
jgi:hypothetical protein